MHLPVLVVGAQQLPDTVPSVFYVYSSCVGARRAVYMMCSLTEEAYAFFLENGVLSGKNN